MATGDNATDAASAGQSLVQHSGGCAPHWHVIATEYQAERLAHQSIAGLGFSVCLPLIRRRTEATAARPSRTITFPAFAGYLLAAWQAGDKWQPVRRARGVAGVITAIGSDTPARLPSAFMAALSARMAGDGVLEDLSVPDLLPALPAMTRVLINRGPLAGQTAIVEWSSEERVALLLHVLGGYRRAQLRRDHVEADQ